jgi:hypothetical protein
MAAGTGKALTWFGIAAFCCCLGTDAFPRFRSTKTCSFLLLRLEPGLDFDFSVSAKDFLEAAVGTLADMVRVEMRAVLRAERSEVN